MTAPPPESRADRFARELAELKIPDPAAGHPRVWQWLGAIAMAAGVVLGVVGYLVSQRTNELLIEGTAVNIALGGLILAIVGGAVFLRYSLTGFLRFWMARQSFELNLFAEKRLAADASEGDRSASTFNSTA